MELVMNSSHFENNLTKIFDDLEDLKFSTYNYFHKDPNSLQDFSTTVKNFNISCGKFNNLFQDLLMEVEELEREDWEYNQALAEQDYYNDVVGVINNGRCD